MEKKSLHFFLFSWGNNNYNRDSKFSRVKHLDTHFIGPNSPAADEPDIVGKAKQLHYWQHGQRVNIL